MYYNTIILWYFNTVADDDTQALRECLNLTEAGADPSPPIVLAAADESKQFLCKNGSVSLKVFTCSHNGFPSELIWRFNDEEIALFSPLRDTVGRVHANEFASVYNLTAILTQVTQVPYLSRLDAPFYKSESVLIVRPFNESQTELEPYNITCLTFCTGNNRPVCQTRKYEVAGMFKLTVFSELYS